MSETYAESQKKLSKESIFGALIKLLDSNSYNNITITQITAIAGVSRMAFYRNYNTKDDIINVYLDDLFESVLQQANVIGCKSKEEHLRYFFNFYYNNKEIIIILLKNNLLHLFYDKFKKHTMDFFKTQPDKNDPIFEDYLALYATGGLYSVLIEWISGGTLKSCEEMTQLTLEITSK